VMVQMIGHHVLIETTYCIHCQTVKKVHDCICNICLLRAITQNEVERSQNTVKAAVSLTLTQCGKKLSTMLMIKFNQSSSTKNIRELNMHP
jgi:hypothetical protein